MKKTSSASDVENQPPLDPSLAGPVSAHTAKRSEAGNKSSRPLHEAASEDAVPFGEEGAKQVKSSGKKSSAGQLSFSSKILLCGGGSGQERESKRKEVDEGSPVTPNQSDPSSGGGGGGTGVHSRKSSRKGSKKKAKDAIPLSSLDAAKEDADPATCGSEAKESSVAGKASQDSNKSCCFCWCCCCSCSW